MGESSMSARAWRLIAGAALLVAGACALGTWHALLGETGTSLAELRPAVCFVGVMSLLVGGLVFASGLVVRP